MMVIESIVDELDRLLSHRLQSDGVKCVRRRFHEIITDWQHQQEVVKAARLAVESNDNIALLRNKLHRLDQSRRERGMG
jgi:hypothetical protein